MSTSIYVGNLPFTVTEDALRQLFSTYGPVESVKLITDRETGQLRGFGFVEMSSGANEAISALHEKDFGGRNLMVNPARPREDRQRQTRRW